MCCNFLHFAGVQFVVSIHSSSSVRKLLKSVPEELSSEGDRLTLEAIAIKIDKKYYRVNVYILVCHFTIICNGNGVVFGMALFTNNNCYYSLG